MVSIPTSVPPGAGGAGTGGASSSPDVQTPIQGGPSTSLTGWNHLLRTFAGGMATSLHQVSILQHASLRELQTKRKVHR